MLKSKGKTCTAEEPSHVKLSPRVYNRVKRDKKCRVTKERIEKIAWRRGGKQKKGKSEIKVAGRMMKKR